MWDEALIYLRKDKYMGPLIEKYGPCKIVVRHHDNYFIDLVDAIVSQQLSIKAAAAIFKKLSDKLDGVVTPDSVLQQKDEDLRASGLSWAKVKYVKDLAERTKDGRLKTEILPKLTNEEILQELTAVKGIGRWTTEMFLMFTLARPDIFPVSDLGIRNGLTKLLGKELTWDEMEKFAQRWSPWRTPASWYVWKVLDQKWDEDFKKVFTKPF